jgi:hypothetical protein
MVAEEVEKWVNAVAANGVQWGGGAISASHYPVAFS